MAQSAVCDSLENEYPLVRDKPVSPSTSMESCLSFEKSSSLTKNLVQQEEVNPLETLDELLNVNNEVFPFNFTVPVMQRVANKNPKTLVCHDFKGGYVEDRFINGVEKECSYNFIHWSLIDIFVYFSHYLVTIPPYGWISAAHKNGTLILGTFITEWDAGAEICKAFLKDMAAIECVCNSLVALAMKWGFDGWLINIENKIEPFQVRCLIEFVKLLTQKMHEIKAHSLVIWYDSIIESGELAWQNCLNSMNRVFFDSCDGIFLNYNWTEQNLKESVSESGSRKLDVYVGVDVFGRGCPGGGGFNTNIAMKALRQHGLSAAIFAPGWVYECLDTQSFWDNQYKFWSSFEEYCHVQTITSLPLTTSFCPGYGVKMCRKGKVVNRGPWFSLSLQAIQPSFLHKESELFEESVLSTIEDSYYGGGCMKLKASNSHEDGPRQVHHFRIFNLSLVFGEDLTVLYTFKLRSTQYDVGLSFDIKQYGKSISLLLISSKIKNKIHPSAKHIYELPDSSYFHQHFDCDAEFTNGGWITRCFFLPCSKYRGCIVKNLNIEIYNISEKPCENFEALIGNLEIKQNSNQTVLIIENRKKSHPSNDEVMLECRLRWNHIRDVHYFDVFYEICNEKECFVGTTSLTYYDIKLKLQLSNFSSNGISFHIYPHTMSFLPSYCREKYSSYWPFD